jgi:FHA domain/Double zinc ribbon
MIICPNCSQENPDSATYCESCYTPLPVVTTIPCPKCGTSVQSDASYCGNCGSDLRSVTPDSPMLESDALIPSEVAEAVKSNPELDQFIEPDELGNTAPELEVAASIEEEIELPEIIMETAPSQSKTQLQVIGASLLHVQTNIKLELPTNLQVIHLGKPNNMIPPDIDVSGFPDSDIVSRVHADIRFEGDAYYFEDTGSSNGTYINNTALPAGNRHRLRPGDRISLGKGDKVTFIFQTPN